MYIDLDESGLPSPIEIHAFQQGIIIRDVWW